MANPEPGAHSRRNRRSTALLNYYLKLGDSVWSEALRAFIFSCADGDGWEDEFTALESYDLSRDEWLREGAIVTSTIASLTRRGSFPMAFTRMEGTNSFDR